MREKNCVTALFLAAVCTHDATLKHKIKTAITTDPDPFQFGG